MAEQPSLQHTQPTSAPPSLSTALADAGIDGSTAADAVADGTVAELAQHMTAVDGNYDASAITVLEGLEAVRKRPGMYIGSTGERGLHHLVYEIVDNAVDEALAGYADTIDVTLLADGGVRVSDNGRGIPTDIHPTEGVQRGRAGADAAARRRQVRRRRLQGVRRPARRRVVGRQRAVDPAGGRGAAEGLRVPMEFANGVPLAPLAQVGPSDETGTTITFWPDGEIFETTTSDFETLRSRFQQMAFLNKGLSITLVDERPDHADEDGTAPAVTFRYDGGLVDYVRHLNASKKTESSTPRSSTSRPRTPSARCRSRSPCSGPTAYSESVHTYANTINTHEGGTHEEGFRAALTTLINEYARAKVILKERKENLTGDDIREGLTAIVSHQARRAAVRGADQDQARQHRGQDASSSAWCAERLGDWLDSHPREAKEIIQKSIQAAAAPGSPPARPARLTRRKGLLGGGGLPGKLSDCQSTDPRECEIFIVEGDSAGGSAKSGRDPRTQAILPIRGKILNVEKARIDRVLANQRSRR